MSNSNEGVGCVFYILVYGVIGAFSGWGVDQVTDYFGKDFPFWLDFIIGLCSPGISFVAGLAVQFL